MDLQRDYPKFKTLISRLCDTLGKRCSDELVESWWKALKHLPLDDVERHVDRFLANAGPDTAFPRPAQMREQHQAPSPGVDQNWLRGYWRSVVIAHVAGDLGLTVTTLEPVVVANATTLGADMAAVLDRCCDHEMRSGRTFVLEQFCRNRCGAVAHAHAHLGTPTCVARTLRLPEAA